MFQYTTPSIWWNRLLERLRRSKPAPPSTSLERASLSVLARLPESQLPEFVRLCPVGRKYLELLGALD